MIKPYNLFIDLKKSVIQTIRGIKQGENNVELLITLTQDSKPVDLTDINVRINYRRPDCKVLLQKVEVVDEKKGLIKVNVLTSVLECAGLVVADISMFDKDDRKITSATFKIMVEASVYTSDYIDEDDLDIIQDIQSKEEERQTNEKIRQENEKERVDSELIRQKSEKTRLDSEKYRETNEDRRKENEIAREKHETTRQENEELRKTNENTRGNRENQREEQEKTRERQEYSREVNEAVRQENEELRKQTQEDMKNVIININEVEEYNNDKAYNKLNRVVYNGSCYECVKDSKGNIPTNKEYWICIAEKGKDGDGAGDMLQSIYDKNGNGIVDMAEDTQKLNGISAEEYVLGQQMVSYVQETLGNELYGTIKTPIILEGEPLNGVGEPGVYYCYECEDAPDYDVYIMTIFNNKVHEDYLCQVIMSLKNEVGAMYCRVEDSKGWQEWKPIGGLGDIEVEEKTYSELSELKENNELIPGKQYRLMDYRTKYEQPDTKVIKEMAIEELLLTAVTKNSFAPIVYSDRYPDDIVYYDFDDKLCEDKRTPRNGFITRRHDTVGGNNCPQDWRTMLWARWKPDAQQYYKNDVLTNYEVWTSGNAKMGVIYKAGDKLLVAHNTNIPSEADDTTIFDTVYNNITIGVLKTEKTKILSQTLDKLELKKGELHERLTFGDNCRNNTFGDGCNNNVFRDNCRDNTFGKYCYNNTFGDNFYNNVFNNMCVGNTFGNTCYYNLFGNNFFKNIFGNSCHGNVIGESSQNNIFGNNCDENSLGNSCNSNTFGIDCDKNSLSNGCGGNVFGNNSNYNSLGNNCANNKLGSGSNYNSFGNSSYGNSFGNNSFGNALNNGCTNNKFRAGIRKITVKNLDNKDLTSIDFNVYATIEQNEKKQYVYWYLDENNQLKAVLIP